MGEARPQVKKAGITLDAGALIAIDRGSGRMIALIERALTEKRNFRVPATVLGQAWRDGRTQANLARFMRSREVEIIPLDGPLARSCGELCASTGTSDVTDASVVLVGRQHGDVIITSDAAGLRRLDPKASIVTV